MEGVDWVEGKEYVQIRKEEKLEEVISKKETLNGLLLIDFA